MFPLLFWNLTYKKVNIDVTTIFNYGSLMTPVWKTAVHSVICAYFS